MANEEETPLETKIYLGVGYLAILLLLFTVCGCIVNLVQQF